MWKHELFTYGEKVSGTVAAKLCEQSRVMSNTLTNSNQFYENADLTQNFTMRKDWNFEFVSAAFAGVYTITQ